MLTVTEGAKQMLKGILAAHGNDPGSGVRLVVEPPGQVALQLGQEKPGDHVVEHEGSKVLLIASDIAHLVDNRTLDVVNESDGPQLVLQ